MTVGDSLKSSINEVFRHCVFRGRDKKTVINTLRTKVHGSGNVYILPLFKDVELERLDEEHDKMTVQFDDYSFSGIITWKLSHDGRSFVFLSYE